MKQRVKVLFVVVMILALLFSMNVTSAFADDIDPEFFFSEIQQVGIGYIHTTFLMKDGTVWTCGLERPLPQTSIVTPVKVQNLTDVICVAAGLQSSLAVKSDGSVWEWKENTLPTQIGISDAIYADMRPANASSSYHVVKSDGTVWAWGYNSAGELGDGTTTNRSTPVQVKENSTTPLTDVQTVVVGDAVGTVLFLKSDGTVWSCGSGAYGLLGRTGNNKYAEQINELTGIVDISVGNSHCLALKSDGTMWAWGFNDYRQLGDGTTTARTAPVMVTNGISNIKAVGAGSSTSYALKTDGTVWAWGNDYSLGINAPYPGKALLTPVQINKLRNIKSVTTQNNNSVGSLAIGHDGSVWCWGTFGDKGHGLTNSSMPVKINEPTPSSGPVEPYQFSAVFEIDQGQIRFLGMEPFEGDENNLEWFLDFPWPLFMASLVPFITMVGMR